MPVFTLYKIEEIRGKILFYKLMKNGVCFFDDFENQIKTEATYTTELDRIQSIMEQVSELKSLPGNKYKNITRKKDIIKSYEIKTKNLRVYLFKDRKGNIIVLGGKKVNQNKDITIFRGLIDEFYKSQK